MPHATVGSSCCFSAGVRRMAATITGQGRQTEDRDAMDDREDKDDRENKVATGGEGDMPEKETAAGNTNDYHKISTIIQ